MTRKRSVWLATALVLVFFAQGFASLHQKAPTFDEVTYFGIGHYLLATGKFDVPGSGTHPPLAFYLSSLPLLDQPLDSELWSYTPKQRRRAREEFSLAHDAHRGNQLFAQSQPQDRDLNRGRSVILSLGFVLGPLIFLWSLRCFGIWGALVSVTLFAFDPNLLAHARLITPDFVLTTTFFAAAYFAAAARGSGRLSQWVWVGVFAGLALLSKHAALVLVPALMVSLLFDWVPGELRSRAAAAIFDRWPRGESKPGRVSAFLIASGVAALVFLIGLQFDVGPYIESLNRQLAHADSGHSAFLGGAISERGWWYYHLAAMALKTPLPLIFLVAAAVWCGPLRRMPRHERWLLAFPSIALLVLFSLVRGPDIGLRYVLPVYPFLIVMAGGAAQVAAPRKVARVVLLLLLAWHVAGSVRVYPDYLAYFNETIGGPANGHRYLVDSNLDWGQDLKQLEAYMDEHGLATVRLSYFGAADPDMYGISYKPLPGFYLGQKRRLPRRWRGTYAISATHLAGVYLDGDYYAALRDREPDAVIGHSIFLYHFDATNEPPATATAARRVTAERSQQASEARRVAD